MSFPSRGKELVVQSAYTTSSKYGEVEGIDCDLSEHLTDTKPETNGDQ